MTSVSQVSRRVDRLATSFWRIMAYRWSISIFMLGLLLMSFPSSGCRASQWLKAAEKGTFSAKCNPQTGLAEPLALCTPENPCRHQKGHLISTPSSKPTCVTSKPKRSSFNDGPPVEWRDDSSTTRYACVFRPPGTTRKAPRPLVLWLHGGEGSADDLYNYTSLRQKAPSFNLSGDASRPGFILVSIQGRNIHYPTVNPPGSREGPHHDFYFRDFRTKTANPDFNYYDHLIDAVVAEGIVDAQRIYLMGWSNGGFMAQAYGIARHTTLTPGGNRVAAAMAFGSADPFNNATKEHFPSCQLDRYPESRLPVYLIQRSCDAANACSPEQHRKFDTPPGYVLTQWVDRLKNKLGNQSAVLQLVDDQGNPTDSCDDGIRCTFGARRGILNHVRWPDGVADGGGRDWELEMLGFLRNHPHP